MRGINLFDPDLGIQSVLENQDNYKLPGAKQFATPSTYDTSLEAVYNLSNTKSMLEDAVCPDMGNGEIVRSDVFSNSLERCALAHKNSKDQDVQDFLKKDLYPLLENEGLLRTYYNLMLGG